MISQRLLEANEYEAWAQRYDVARADMDNRDEAVRACIESLEQDMDLLCVTGVEGNHCKLIKLIDKLQDEVALSIEALRSAGIQIWMLTGDKVETATCIALSAGFKSRHQQLFYIRDCTSLRECESLIGQFSLSAEKLVLMIDGQSLDLIMTPSID